MTTFPLRTPGHGPVLRAALIALLLAAAAAVGAVIGLFPPAPHSGSHPSLARGPRNAPAGPANLHSGPRHPNIVFVLTDDLSMDLLRFMPHVQAMERTA